MLSPQALRVELSRAGIVNAAVDAAWPQWWSSEAESSLSATAELTFTIARRLGLSPQDLLDGEARFVWRDETKFKRLTAVASAEEQALSSFGCALARTAVAGADAVTRPRDTAPTPFVTLFCRRPLSFTVRHCSRSPGASVYRCCNCASSRWPKSGCTR